MNYLEYYGLQQEPFTNAPAMKFFYNSAQHSTALLRVMHAIEGMRGLALVLGQAGKGKTTLARRVLEQLSPEVYQSALIVVVHASVEPGWFLKKIARQIGIEEVHEDKVALLAKVSDRLFQIHREGRKTVVLIDEAQMLRSREILEEMRGLLNIEHNESKLITFILFGLPDLDEVLEIDPPLKQRVATRVRLENLSREGAAQYVRHRMRLAGSSKPIFGEGALDQIFLHTRGNPRLINTVCDNALLEGFLLGRDLIDRALVDAVAHDLGLASSDTGRDRGEAEDAAASPAETAPTIDDAAADAEAEPAADVPAFEGEADLLTDEVVEAAPEEVSEDSAEADAAADLLDELTADLDAAEGGDAGLPDDASVDLGKMVDDDDVLLDELVGEASADGGPGDGEVDFAAMLAADDEPAASAGAKEEADVDALLAEFEATGDAEASAASGDDADVDALLAEFEATGKLEPSAASGEDADVDALLAEYEREGESLAPTSGESSSVDDDLDDLLAGLKDDASELVEASDAVDSMLDELGAADQTETPVSAGGADDLDAQRGELGAAAADASGSAAADADLDALLDDLDSATSAVAEADGDADLDALLGELEADSSELDLSGLEGVGAEADVDDLLAEIEADEEAPAKSITSDEDLEIDDLLSQLDELQGG